MIEFGYDDLERSCYVVFNRTQDDDRVDAVVRTDILVEQEDGVMIATDWRADGSLYSIEISLPVLPTTERRRSR